MGAFFKLHFLTTTKISFIVFKEDQKAQKDPFEDKKHVKASGLIGSF